MFESIKTLILNLFETPTPRTAADGHACWLATAALLTRVATVHDEMSEGRRKTLCMDALADPLRLSLAVMGPLFPRHVRRSSQIHLAKQPRLQSFNGSHPIEDVFFSESTPKFAAQAIGKAAEIGWRPVQFVASISGLVTFGPHPTPEPSLHLTRHLQFHSRRGSEREVRQDFKFHSLSFFAAVPNGPSWYTAAPAGEKVNGSNGSASILSR